MLEFESIQPELPLANGCRPLSGSGGAGIADEPFDAPADHRLHRDAGRLAQALRSARLTLVYGTAAGATTALLNAGLLPRLQRRHRDRRLHERDAANRRRPAVERRGTVDSAGRSSEIVVFLDRWQGSPIAALQARMGDALARSGVRKASVALPLHHSLADWSRVLNARFLIVLDRFDDYLAAAVDTEGVRELSEELLKVLECPGLPAHLLICMRDDARPMMTRIATCLTAFQADAEYTYAQPSGLAPIATKVGRARIRGVDAAFKAGRPT